MRQARQLDYIAQMTTDIRHIAGTDNIVADMLSRIAAVTNTATQPVNSEEIADEQNSDVELKEYLQSESPSILLEKVNIPGSDKSIWCEKTSATNCRPFAPSSLRHRIMSQLHGLAHPGRRSTVRLISDRFVWPRMRHDIEEFVKNCLTCQSTKVH